MATQFYALQKLRASALQALVDDHLLVTKSGDTPRATNTTLQDDPHLMLTLQAGYNYACEWKLYFNAPAAADIKFAITFSGTLATFGGLRMVDTSAGLTGNVDPGAYSSATSGSSTITAGGTGGVTSLILYTTVSPSTGGALTLQWAQLAASGTTTLYQGSSMRADRER